MVAVRATDEQLVGLINSATRARQDYAMASRSGAQARRRRGVPSLGASADFHYRHDGDWLWMSELAEDLYRNDYIVGSIVDRAIEQTLQGGIKYDPNTNDKALDDDLKAWWEEETCDARNCSSDAELTFQDMETMALRAIMVPGDIFELPLEDGTVEMVEGYRCRSPKREIREKPVHGIEFVPGSRRRAAYWFLKDNVDPFSQGITKGDLTPYTAWTDDGERNVWHVRNAKRPTQTRGITAFAPLFEPCAYSADLHFLQMVKARAQNVFAFIRSRAANFDPAYLSAESKLGPMATDVALDRERQYQENRQQYSRVSAGSVIDSLPGETVTMASPNTPNAEFFQHYRALLTFVGVNLGMPLVMALMDASETNFSGYRGAVDQARMGFRKNQMRLIRLHHDPFLRFKLLKRAETDPAIAKRLEQTSNPRSKVNLFGRRWNAPGWPYIEPMSDAMADIARRGNTSVDEYTWAAERGYDWELLCENQVRGRGYGLRMAINEAKKLRELSGDTLDIPWLVEHLLPLPTSQTTSISIQAGGKPESAKQPAGAVNDN